MIDRDDEELEDVSGEDIGNIEDQSYLVEV